LSLGTSPRKRGGYLLGATARAVFGETLRHHRLFLLLINCL
jgi:hypothetical protein